MDTAAYKTKSLAIMLKDRLRRLLYAFEVDRAVFFGVLSRIWGIIAGPVTALLIIIKFTPECQGYYYTFSSLLALQVFVELGLGTVIIQFASHEWSKLKIDKNGNIAGDKEALSRLASLANISFKWYAVGGVIIAICLSLGGCIFFLQSHNNTQISWMLPWFFACFFTGISLWLVPMWSLLEGCNQVSTVYAYRFFQGIVSNIAIWIAIFSGAGLWSASIFAAVSILCAVLFLSYRYCNFIRSLLFSGLSSLRINWRTEMLPMQWRIAVSWISGYFLFSFFTPVIFRYHGPVAAGQFGMTWSIILMVCGISGAWVSPRAPRFGVLVAKKEYEELDSLFGRMFRVFILISVATAVALWAAVYVLYAIRHPFASRLLPVLPTTIFLAAQMVMMVSLPFSVYLRAHKKEPIFLVSVCGTILVACSTFFLGKYYPVTYVGFGYLVINLILVLCIIAIWYHCRATWHNLGLDHKRINMMKKLGKAVLFLSALPFVITLRAIRPFLWLRFIELDANRIGHCAANTEIYLYEKDVGLHGNRVRDIFYYAPPVCNKQLLKMWSRLVPVTGSRFVRQIVLANRKILGWEAHELIKANPERDTRGAVDMIKQRVFFTKEEEGMGRSNLISLGIPQDKPFVCFHARDNAYLASLYPQFDWSYHDYRDVDIGNYSQAIERLAENGYYAVRMGNIVKEKFPIARPEIIDYAYGHMRSDFLDIYLLSKCSFFINSECGISNVSRLFRRPAVYVNQIPLGHAVTWDPNSIMICKKLWLKKEKRFLKFREILKSEIGRFIRSENYQRKGIEVIQNTPEEIWDAAEEMAARLEGRWEESEEDKELQAKFQSLYEGDELHNKIKLRMGSKFLRQNKGLLI